MCNPFHAKDSYHISATLTVTWKHLIQIIIYAVFFTAERKGTSNALEEQKSPVKLSKYGISQKHDHPFEAQFLLDTSGQLTIL